MVAKTIKFTLNIPNWVYRWRWSNLQGWLLFHLKPYRCTDCGVKLPFRWYDIKIERTPPLKQSLSVSYTVTKECICPDCILKRLEKVEKNPLFEIYQEREYYNIQKECDVCGKPKTSYKAIRMSDGIIDNMRFCTRGSWNGNYVCLDCAKFAIKYGVLQSTIYSSYKGRSVPINDRGLPVVDGKVKFPDR